MRDAIKSSFLAKMAETLEPIELGAAVRILVRLCEKKGPIAKKTIHLVAGIDKATWADMEESVLAHFCVDEAGVALIEAASHPIPSVAKDAKSGRKGSTPPLFPSAQGEGPKPESLPSYLAKTATPVSIRRAIYDTGLRVLLAAGVSERIARSTISGWLKAYSEGAVAEAVADAQTRKDLDDPHSWIVARLRASARGVRMHPGVDNGAPRVPKARGDAFNGMSEKSLVAMMDRNKALRGKAAPRLATAEKTSASDTAE